MTIPSQRRYLHYFHNEIVSLGRSKAPQPAVLRLHKLSLLHLLPDAGDPFSLVFWRRQEGSPLQLQAFAILVAQKSDLPVSGQFAGALAPSPFLHIDRVLHPLVGHGITFLPHTCQLPARCKPSCGSLDACSQLLHNRMLSAAAWFCRYLQLLASAATSPDTAICLPDVQHPRTPLQCYLQGLAEFLFADLIRISCSQVFGRKKSFAVSVNGSLVGECSHLRSC